MSSGDTGATVKWANPGALGLMCFGFNTILLQIHNLGVHGGDVPIVWAFFWGGLAQIICGLIEARRGDTFAFTAFTGYGAFWMGFALLHVMGHTKDAVGIAWGLILWGVFTLYMTFAAAKITNMHLALFAAATALFWLLALALLKLIPVQIAAWEGIICGGIAVYGSAASILNEKYGRIVLPLGIRK
jgi:succinate-acetate transporter protein